MIGDTTIQTGKATEGQGWTPAALDSLPDGATITVGGWAWTKIAMTPLPWWTRILVWLRRVTP